MDVFGSRRSRNTHFHSFTPHTTMLLLLLAALALTSHVAGTPVHHREHAEVPGAGAGSSLGGGVPVFVMMPLNQVNPDASLNDVSQTIQWLQV